jgi:hypothetical protein
MVLGGLIALSSDQEIGKLGRKVASENVFLGKWLKRVKKQRCYPKSIASDIDSFLRIYFIEGRTGNLASLFKQIYNEFQLLKYIPNTFSQTERKRFDNAISSLARDGWFISIPIKQNIDINTPYRATHKKEIFTSKSYWDGAFNETNKIIKPFSIFVVSDPQEVIDCMYEHGFVLIRGMSSNDDEGNCYYQYQILPNNNCHGSIAIPSQFQRYS